MSTTRLTNPHTENGTHESKMYEEKWFDLNYSSAIARHDLLNLTVLIFLSVWMLLSSTPRSQTRSQSHPPPPPPIICLIRFCFLHYFLNFSTPNAGNAPKT